MKVFVVCYGERKGRDKDHNVKTFKAQADAVEFAKSYTGICNPKNYNNDRYAGVSICDLD